MKRVIFDVVLLLSVFLLPWWISTILAVAGIFIFIQFYEFLGAGVMMYSLYIVPTMALLTKPIWFAVMIVAIYISIQILRRYIILYKS